MLQRYRVSTDKQGKSGLGIEAQRQAVENYLNGGNWKLIGEFTARYATSRSFWWPVISPLRRVISSPATP